MYPPEQYLDPEIMSYSLDNLNIFGIKIGLWVKSVSITTNLSFLLSLIALKIDLAKPILILFSIISK